MRILKKIIVVLVMIVAVLLIMALFVKKDYAIQREIIIDKPKQEVFNYIRYLKNQDHYSKWNQLDANMIKSYTGTDGEPGFVYHWESKKDDVGIGEQEIKKINDGERVDFEIRFIKPFESTAQAYMLTQTADANSTKVIWAFNGKMNYPMNLMLLFMNMEKMVGGDLEIGLNNLKNVLENK